MVSDKPDETPDDAPPFDEVASARIGRRLRAARELRERVFARQPDDLVTPSEAAAVLGLTAEELELELADGAMGSEVSEGQRIIRVVHLREYRDADLERKRQFAEEFTKLRADIDLDE